MEEESNKNKWWKLLGIIAGICFVFCIGYYNGSYARSAQSTVEPDSLVTTVKTTIPTITNKNIPAGEYRIGKDLESGEYKIVADDGLCLYFLRSDSKATDSSISSGSVHGQKYVTVLDGQYLEVSSGHLEKVN